MFSQPGAPHELSVAYDAANLSSLQSVFQPIVACNILPYFRRIRTEYISNHNCILLPRMIKSQGYFDYFKVRSQWYFFSYCQTTTINCLDCQYTKTIAIGKFRSTWHTMIASCTCGHTFPISLDSRRCCRKKTALPFITQMRQASPLSSTQGWRRAYFFSIG